MNKARGDDVAYLVFKSKQKAVNAHQSIGMSGDCYMVFKCPGNIVFIREAHCKFLRDSDMCVIMNVMINRERYI